MKSGSSPKGFTIVESLVFLSVSGALLAGAFTLFSVKQNSILFRQSLEDVQQIIDQTINNVANGYYAGTTAGTNTCAVGADEAKVDLASGGSPTTRGKSTECIYLGRVMEFYESNTNFSVYDVVGASFITNTRIQSTNLPEAKPTVLTGSKNDVLYKNGLKFKYMKKLSSGPNYGQLGFFTSFNTTYTSDDVQSKLKTIDFLAFGNTSGVPDIATQMSDPDPSSSALRNIFASEKNPPEGIELCFESGTTNNQIGKIVIGGNLRSASTTLTISNGTCI